MNISARYAFAFLVAPSNSFQAKIPHSAATIGADCPIEYEIATPVKFAATRLKTVPTPQTEPPEVLGSRARGSPREPIVLLARRGVNTCTPGGMDM